MLLPRKNTGSLIIDLVAAAAIFLFVTGAFYAACASKDRALEEMENLTHASNAAHAKIEALRALPHGELMKSNGAVFSVPELGSAGNKAGNITAKETGPSMAEVTVTIAWKNRGGADDKIEYSTITRDNGGGEEWK